MFMTSRIEITEDNKSKIQNDFVSKMMEDIEQELDAMTKKYSGFGPGRQTNFKRALSRALEETLVKPPIVPPVDSHIPSHVEASLKQFGFSIENADMILSLISLPENSTIEWWKNYNYAERLHDGRGWTVTLYGACSGTGDLLMILEALQKINSKHPLVKFIPAMRKTKGDDIRGLENLGKVINVLGDDKEWQEAVWEIYIKLYWTFATDFADKKNSAKNRPGAVLTSPLTHGFMIDVALNHGANMESFEPILKNMKNREEKDEAKWFLDFCEARRKLLKSGFQQLDTSKTGDRCTLWANIFKSGNVGLKRPIQCFDGYWGKNFVIA
ncbi:chitosanase [Paramecium bursaria Chlorella virus NY2B]|nr:chitosanase [Paramecium bursaria Chlorella virus IL-5-2s1]AGE58337.1 chitosanase [Paramecium bursaria Chlorella virus NY2B]